MAETLESSDHTSVQLRIKAITKQDAKSEEENPCPSSDAFLSPLTIDEQSDPIGPCTNQNGRRCSDKGFLAVSIKDYSELLDWSARQVAPGKRGSTPCELPSVLKRFGLDGTIYCELVNDFGKLFCNVAGRPEQGDSLRSHRTHRRYYLRRRTRELFASS